jgi:hypothetical protein
LDETEQQDPVNKNEMVYRLGNYPYALMRSKDPILGIDKHDYINESMIIVGANNQTAFADSAECSFHEWLIVRIESPTEIKIVKKFIHAYEEKYQGLYFSEDFNFMHEILENERIFFHQWNEEGHKWKMIRRMMKYPSSIEGASVSQQLLCPDF